MFGSNLVLLGACLTAINVLSGVNARECDDSYMISIENSTDIDFYKTCPNLNSTMFFIDHTFTGPFEMAGVESLYQMSSGYYGPKLKGSDRVDDGVTSVSMPDLVDITTGGMLFGYVDNLTSISFPKLSTMVGDLAIAGSYELRNISLPALSTIDGAIYLDGDFDQIDFPSLKSVKYIRVESTGNISCPALGAAWASINFTGDDTDLYQGFTCWTGYETNSWNSSDPDNNPGSNSSSDTKYGYPVAEALITLY
ncbi:hypothetical protein E8E14_005259 [Neopestalotiopsis sp. 37M]|nr:hypothetical protein E8E14_005259 [Neopestalotiopsis sp. 37M]